MVASVTSLNHKWNNYFIYGCVCEQPHPINERITSFMVASVTSLTITSFVGSITHKWNNYFINGRYLILGVTSIRFLFVELI